MVHLAQLCSDGMSVAFGAGNLSEPTPCTMPQCLLSWVAGHCVQAGLGVLASTVLEVSRNEKGMEIGSQAEGEGVQRAEGVQLLSRSPPVLPCRQAVMAHRYTRQQHF